MNLIIVEINFDDTYFQLMYAQNVGNINAFSKCCKKIVYKYTKRVDIFL